MMRPRCEVCGYRGRQLTTRKEYAEFLCKHGVTWLVCPRCYVELRKAWGKEWFRFQPLATLPHRSPAMTDYCECFDPENR